MPDSVAFDVAIAVRQIAEDRRAVAACGEQIPAIRAEGDGEGALAGEVVEGRQTAGL
jgi:hypothetical protein